MASDPNTTAPNPDAVTGYDPYTGPGTPNYTVTSGLGPRNIRVGSSNHKGVDLAAPVGSPVYAIADGVVSLREQRDRSGNYTGYGKYIDVSHGHTENGKEVESLTAHLSRFAVKDGQEVKKGDIIGYSGNTGTGTGPHIHQEFRVGGVAYDYRDAVAGGRDILSGPPSARVTDPLADGVLRRDERGKAVERLQEYLVREGYGPIVGTPDGRFGPKTEAAVRHYQEQKSLGLDGVAGPETLRSLGMTAEPASPAEAPTPSPPSDPAPALPTDPAPTPSGATALDTPGAFAAVSSADLISRSPGEGRLDLATTSRPELDAILESVVGRNAAAEFVAAIDDRYGEGQGAFHTFILSLMGHEGNFAFGRENADPAAGFNVGTFQEGGSHIRSQAESREQYEGRVDRGVAIMEREIGRELTAEELQNPAVRDMAAFAANREERSASILPALQAYARAHPDSYVAARMAPFADVEFTGDPTQLWTILSDPNLTDEQRIESAAYLSQGGIRDIGVTLLENRTPGGAGYYVDMELVFARAAEPDALRAEPAFPRLSAGDAGPAVVDLQSALVDLGYDLGTSGPNGDGVDGLFGARTRTAVGAEQAEAGLRANGRVGPDTWAHIAAAVSQEVAVEQNPAAPARDEEATAKTPAEVLAEDPGGKAYAEVLAALVGKLVAPNVSPEWNSQTDDLPAAAVIVTDALFKLAQSEEPLTPEAMQATIDGATPGPSEPLNEPQLAVLGDLLGSVRYQAGERPAAFEAFAAIRAEEQAAATTPPASNETRDPDRGRETPAGTAPTEADRPAPGGDGQSTPEEGAGQLSPSWLPSPTR